MSELLKHLKEMHLQLENKLVFLKEIHQLTISQGALLKVSDMNLDDFYALINTKQKFLDSIDRIDRDFEQSYNVVKSYFNDNIQKNYKEEIAELKRQIQQIIEMGIVIKDCEEQNKTDLTNFILSKKDEIKKYRNTKNVANLYHKNLSNTHKDNTSYFMDKKK